MVIGKVDCETIQLCGESLILYPEKAIFWKSENMLLIADVHLGKIIHFRKAGIPVPFASEQKNFEVLDSLIYRSQCAEIVFLGDLFHSNHNQVCDAFILWRKNYPAIKMHLIIGNHDILNSAFYVEAGLELAYSMETGPFRLTHKPEEKSTKLYNIAGHIHPGIRLIGKARQSVSLSCFYFGKTNAIMPSFGDFTGNYIIKPQQHDQIYVVAENYIRKVL